MGYYTSFSGEVTITPHLTNHQQAYLNEFLAQRFMTYHELEAIAFETNYRRALREQVGLPARPEFMIFGENNPGHRSIIKDCNRPTPPWPSLWCPWELEILANQQYLHIPYEGKHYDYVEWLVALVNNFFIPWDLTLNGEVEWYGEDRDDRGLIMVENNAIFTADAKVAYYKRVYAGGAEPKDE